MTNLKKFLLLMLVLSTLGYSSAWAFDSHVIDSVETETLVSGLQNKSSVNPASVFQPSQEHASQEHADDDIACDHCCHISAHLQAIFSKGSILCSAYLSSNLQDFSESFISFIASPDIKPPRV